MPRRVLFFALLATLLDQASKLVMVHLVMDPPHTIEVTGFFNLVLSYNRGVSFGILASDLWFKPFLLSLIAVVIVALLLWWQKKHPDPFTAIGTGLIAGGALGNVIDRLYLGAVVDFLDFHAGGYHWPAFNIADSAITIGVAILLIDGLFRRPQGAK